MGGGEDRNRGGLEKRSGEAGEEAGRSGRNWCGGAAKFCRAV